MFSQVSVCPQGGGGMHGTHAPSMHPPQQTLWDALNERAVCILLECILVRQYFHTFCSGGGGREVPMWPLPMMYWMLLYGTTPALFVLCRTEWIQLISLKVQFFHEFSQYPHTKDHKEILQQIMPYEIVKLLFDAPYSMLRFLPEATKTASTDIFHTIPVLTPSIQMDSRDRGSWVLHLYCIAICHMFSDQHSPLEVWTVFY